MVTPTLKATVDQLSDAERRDLLHYLEQTVDELMQRVRAGIQ